MALPTSGPLSLTDIQTEFGGSNPISLSEYYAGGSYVPSGASGTNGPIPTSGAISLSDFYGASKEFRFNITTNTTNANLRTLALAAGWGGNALVICTINSGVIISGNTAGNSTAAMTIDGSFPGGVILVNNGQIRGRGGNGGAGAFFTNACGNGGTGGRALRVTVPASVNNQGNIWAGGGGGGGSGPTKNCNATTCYGGGGGGGRSSNINSAGGVGPGAAANGSPGTLASAGAGGAGAGLGHPGGNGGNVGSPGSAGQNGSGTAPGAGGAAGQAVNGNSNITWINTGSILGVIA
jgi:hypothetical protein